MGRWFILAPIDLDNGPYVLGNGPHVLGWVGHPFFSKERNILAFFPVLYKRTEQSLRSFPFFIKEQNNLCILSRSL